MNLNQPPIGTRVRVLVPGTWARYGVVVDTDYHPLGFDDACQIRFEDGPAGPRVEWWSCHWVFKDAE